MRRSILRKIAIGSILLLSMGVGCDSPRWVLFPAGITVGALVSSLFPQTTTTRDCYRDGVLVDCSTLSVPVE